jgi:uncharacterized membrane protein SpoIIM required for sporulation
LGPEILQFLTMIAIFAAAGVVWLRTIYRPGRTLERWEGEGSGSEPVRVARRSESPTAE